MTLLGKVIPLQIGGKDGGPIEYDVRGARELTDAELTIVALGGGEKSEK